MKELLEKIPNWLRWLLLFPCALAAHFVVYPIIIILNNIETEGFPYNIKYFREFFEILKLILANIGSTASFIWVGAIIAPKNNFLISIIMSIIIDFILVFMFYTKILLGKILSISWFETILCVLTGVVTSFFVVRDFYKKEKLKNNNYTFS